MVLRGSEWWTSVPVLYTGMLLRQDREKTRFSTQPQGARLFLRFLNRDVKETSIRLAALTFVSHTFVLKSKSELIRVKDESFDT